MKNRRFTDRSPAKRLIITVAIMTLVAIAVILAIPAQAQPGGQVRLACQDYTGNVRIFLGSCPGGWTFIQVMED